MIDRDFPRKKVLHEPPKNETNIAEGILLS